MLRESIVLCVAAAIGWSGCVHGSEALLAGSGTRVIDGLSGICFELPKDCTLRELSEIGNPGEMKAFHLECCEYSSDEVADTRSECWIRLCLTGAEVWGPIVSGAEQAGAQQVTLGGRIATRFSPSPLPFGEHADLVVLPVTPQYSMLLAFSQASNEVVEQVMDELIKSVNVLRE